MRTALSSCFSACCALLAGCQISSDTVEGSGKVVTRTFPARDFSTIHISGPFEAEVHRGGSFGVAVTLDDNLQDRIAVSQQGSRLEVIFADVSLERGTLHADIEVPALEGLQLSSAATATVAGFEPADALTLRLSGAGQLYGEIEARAIQITCSGSSRIKVKGSAGDVRLYATGASVLDLSGLPAERARVELDGTSQLSMRVTKRLDYEVSDGSKFSYAGNPELGVRSISGGSSVETIERR